MALVGYARCSTTPQELEHQLEGLKAALVDQLFSEHISGAAPVSYTHLTLPTICSV